MLLLMLLLLLMMMMMVMMMMMLCFDVLLWSVSATAVNDKSLPVVRSAPSLQQVASYSTSDSSKQVFLSCVLIVCQ